MNDMKTTPYAIGAGLALLTLVGCGSKSGYVPKPAAAIPEATVAAGKETDLWPMTLGNQWVYEAETSAQTAQGSGSQKSDVTFKVSKSDSSNGVTNAVLDIINEGKIVDQTSWRVDSTGIYQTASNKLQGIYDPPQPMVKFPVKAGDEFTHKGTGPVPMGGIGNQSTTNKVLGSQVIDTAAGRMSALAVESTTTFTKDGKTAITRTTVWLAPGKGLVRYRQETRAGQNVATQLFRLKDFMGSKP